jgi:hypothetical protein
LPKPSNSSPRNSPDWRPPLFLDATSSTPILARILRAAEWDVWLHSEHFKDRPNIPDHEWIPIATQLGCAIITSDKRMMWWTTENGLVRPVIESCGAKVFFVRGSGLTLEDQAHAIGLARREICRHCRRYGDKFFIARIHTRGSRIGEVQPLAAWKRAKQEKFDSGVA